MAEFFGLEIAGQDPAAEHFLSSAEGDRVVGVGDVVEALLDGVGLRHPAISGKVPKTDQLDVGGLGRIDDLQDVAIVMVAPENAKTAVGAVEVAVGSHVQSAEQGADYVVVPFVGEVERNVIAVAIFDGGEGVGDDEDFAGLAVIVGVDLEAEFGRHDGVVWVEFAHFLQSVGLVHSVFLLSKRSW